MRNWKSTALAVSLGVLSGAGAMAQGFEPRANCMDVLRNATADEKQMIAAWSFGYIAANTQNVRPVDASNNTVLMRNLERVCQQNPQASLIALVHASSSQNQDSGAAQVQPGSKAQAEQLLRAFLDPGADHRALTQAILPNEADVKLVYNEPLASSIWASLQAQMGPNVAFVPKQGQTDLLIVYTTTRDLVQQRPVLQEFPGGYKQVLQYFKTNVPIVRFKFVEPGQTSGFAFDGLVYVNGRWVIIPKPWKAL